MTIKKLSFLFYLLISNALLAQKAEVKLLFIGDVMGHGPQIEAAYNSQTKTYNYNDCFLYIKDILSQPDFTIGNLEVTLAGKPYTGYPLFSSPIELAVALKNSGIDVLATANNHSCDRGKKGIEKTIFALDTLGITHTGTFLNLEHKEQSGLTLLDRNGIKIGLLNYTYGTNGISVPEPTLVNILDKELILKDIQTAKKSKPDVLIAFVHWGLEYKDLPVEEQKKWFDFFKESGISIVIGSHPHVVEPMKWDKNEQTLVVYSLGNFISNQRFFPSDGGALFELTLTKDEQNQVKISRAEYILTWVYKKISSGKTDYYVLPIDEFQYKKHFFHQKKDYEQMMKFTHHARILLQKNNLNISEKEFFTKYSKFLMREVLIK